MAAHAGHAANAAHQTALAEGEIKKIDKETGKVTIRHGELRNLGN
jgi:Cu/Ag efflux protein CusF